MTEINGSARAAREAARHPDGTFGEQLHTDPGQVDLDYQWPDTPVNNHLRTICNDAGLPVMREFLGIVAERGRIRDQVWLALTLDDVEVLYADTIGPAVDEIEGSFDTGAGGPTVDMDVLTRHLADVSREAGYYPEMADVLRIVVDRGEVPDSELMALTADDITEMYRYSLEGAVDSLEEQVGLTEPDAYEKD